MPNPWPSPPMPTGIGPGGQPVAGTTAMDQLLQSAQRLMNPPPQEFYQEAYQNMPLDVMGGVPTQTPAGQSIPPGMTVGGIPGYYPQYAAQVAKTGFGNFFGGNTPAPTPPSDVVNMAGNVIGMHEGLINPLTNVMNLAGHYPVAGLAQLFNSMGLPGPGSVPSAGSYNPNYAIGPRNISPGAPDTGFDYGYAGPP